MLTSLVKSNFVMVMQFCHGSENFCHGYGTVLNWADEMAYYRYQQVLVSSI